MDGASLRQLQDGATAAVDALRPGDRASIVTFNAAIARATPWTGDRTALGAAIEHLRAAGTTSLFDAATAAMLQRDPEPGRRHLLIVFTDGNDTSSWLPDSVAYDLAARTDVVIYGITTAAPISRDTALQWRSGIRLAPQQPIVSSTDFLAKLATQTGGEHLRSVSADLRRTFAQVVAEFRTRYVLWYSPSEGLPATGWHPIAVRLKGASGHATARRGYER